MSRRAERFALVALLLMAAWLRFHRLDEIPPGMTHDEGAVGFFVRHVAAGQPFAIDAPFGYANEPFTKYAAALVMLLVGPSDWALRAYQAAWGVVTALAAYLWGRSAFGRAAGLGSAALTAVSFWPVMTSRFALNSNPAPGLFALSAWFLWRGLFDERLRGRWLAWAGFALSLGGALVTYEASRGAWLALPAFLIYLAAFGPRRRLAAFAVAAAAGTALALPHLLNPAAWGRTSTLAVPLASAASGDFGPLFANTLEALGTLHFKGDPFIVYNIPGRPVLDPVTGLLFAGGLLYCLWGWRRPACAFSLLWLAAGFAPALPTGAFTMMLHAVPTQVVVFTLPVVAVEALVRFITKSLRHKGQSLGVTDYRLRITHSGLRFAFIALLASTAVITCRDYFHRWADDPETRAAYFANFGAVTDYLRRAPYHGPVTLSSPFPGLPHDPFVADLRIRRTDLDLVWFDAREALVFPPVGESLLVLASNAPADPVFADHLPLANAERHVVRETDVDSYFDTVLWNPAAALAGWLANESLTPVQPPADFGGAASLIAYRLVTPDARPGGAVHLVTLWRIDDPAGLGPVDRTNYGREAVLFVHLLDAEGQLVAGQDRLDAPAWDWRPGNTFAQFHRPNLPADLPPGDYRLEIGLYTRPSLRRIPVLGAGGEAVGDAAELGSVHVGP